VLPHALRFNSGAAGRELAPAAARLGLPGQPAEAADQLVNWLHELQHAIGVPSRLRDLGIARDQLAGIAQKTMHERGLAYNPRNVSNASELEAILLAAW
jgi:alcohol dehydrogenase